MGVFLLHATVKHEEGCLVHNFPTSNSEWKYYYFFIHDTEHPDGCPWGWRRDSTKVIEDEAPTNHYHKKSWRLHHV